MTRSRPVPLLAGAAVIPLVALTIAACGGGGAAATASPPPSTSAPTTAPAQTTTVRVASSRLGRILVDSTGRTLYLFKADVGMKSACSGACATAWPPLLAAGTPAVGAGLTVSKLGTITRSDGGRQVTCNGHPLYTFIEDKEPGDVNGEGVSAFGAAWFAVSPAGNQISSRRTGHGSGSAPSRPAAPTAPQPQPAPKAAAPASKPAAPKRPVAKPAPPANNGIPQNGGGDDDSDNHGGPSDGDGDI